MVSRRRRCARCGDAAGAGAVDGVRPETAVPNLQAAEGSGTAYQNGQTTTNYPGAFGVMKLTLDQNGYSWDYESAPAPSDSTGNPAWASFSDTGSGTCHGPSQGG